MPSPPDRRVSRPASGTLIPAVRLEVPGSLLHSGGPNASSTGILRDRSSARNSGNFGSGRNAFTGPSFFNSDMSLFKNFAITERVGAQFRFEAFNVFNHVNLNNPNNCIDCSGSGLITSLAPNAQMRQLNFGMKVTF